MKSQTIQFSAASNLGEGPGARSPFLIVTSSLAFSPFAFCSVALAALAASPFLPFRPSAAASTAARALSISACASSASL